MAQSHDEEQRIFQASLDKTIRLPVGSNQYEIARQKIKRCWVEQGIWNDNWDQFASGLWKHEEPLEVESETETDLAPESPLDPFTCVVTPLQSKKRSDRRQLKSEEDRRRISERRAVREREREASRPYYQFVFQISKERERIQDESTDEECIDMSLPDINTRAYENIKNIWIRRRIWNKTWGVLPGMTWKHEEPLEEVVDDSALQVNAADNDVYEVNGSIYND